MLGRTLLSLASLLSVVVAQSVEVAYTDPNGITLNGAYDSSVGYEFGFVFPTSTTGTEFIGELVVPVANKWAGLALGPGMVGNLLIMGWPYNGGFVGSARLATAYAYPSPYYGPTITTLPYSKTNSTHWTWVFRCQNCTSWSGGSLAQATAGGMGYVLSTNATTTPSSPNSTFTVHTYDSIASVDFTNAHSSKYSSWLSPTTTTKSPTSTPTTTPTPTTKPSTTPTTTPTTTPKPTCAPVAQYGQCGGNGYTGCTVCASGFACKAVSPPYYSQCQ